MFTLIQRLMAALRAQLLPIIERPSPSLAVLVGMLTFVLSALLGSDLISIPADSHFWMLQGVLTLDPPRLALFGYWLLLWVACTQMVIVSAKAFDKFRFSR